MEGAQTMTTINVLSRKFQRLTEEHSIVIDTLRVGDIVLLHEHCADMARNSWQMTDSEKFDNAALSSALSGYPFYIASRNARIARNARVAS